MNKVRLILIFLLLVTFLQTCKEPFEAKSTFGETDFLVVEGYINVGEGITQIKLSRVVQLEDEVGPMHETDANVAIEDDDGNTYSLHNRGDGLYESDSLNLTLTNDYRLRIATAFDKVYVSDFTTPIQTPLIDSVNWQKDSEEEINIYVNTHDPANKTLYYKWDFEEVWEVRSAFVSNWIYQNGELVSRPSDDRETLYYCWKYNSNTDFVMASTAQLTSDVISLFPIVHFPVTNPRLGWRYSIIVKQRALSKEEFEFLQVVKKNSNDLGGFFDAQPSQLMSNVRCTTDEETVVGFVGSYTTEAQRIFIYHSQISDFEYVTQCQLPITLLFTDPTIDDIMQFFKPINEIYEPPSDDAPKIIGFTAAPNYCMDCRVLSGNGLKPSFWIAEDED